MRIYAMCRCLVAVAMFSLGLCQSFHGASAAQFQELLAGFPNSRGLAWGDYDNDGRPALSGPYIRTCASAQRRGCTMGVRGLWRMAVLLVLVSLLALSVAFADIAIPGKLMVSGSDGVNPVVYFMEDTTSNTTPAPIGFYDGDISPDGAQVVYIVGVTATSLT